ncbi:glucose-6-phosphate dehydrogenase [Methylibium sp.]|uniref:glucose-6-phosphate dehydrogenase n=1 Tax=Methylibium sp. TaxID=2067992 RepID=UPI0017BAD7E5|nr:glucose-6-phosphate dehydrogenase [Methylibium sp.]MBA3590157.1 glucose-6-phosphate dehydrogenase [Methylibium sp.]
MRENANNDRFDLVLFGGTGDLAMRKLLPALFYGVRDGGLAGATIIGAARQPLGIDEYRALLTEQVPRHIGEADFDDAVWQRLLSQVRYVAIDATQPADFAALAAQLSNDEAVPRVFYLATTPSLFIPICQHLQSAGLVTPATRVVLEKPLGRDLASSRTINDAVGEIFTEEQTYRIDHYLGKEMVQNLMALRFGNTLLEPLWSRSYIHDVQITIAEELGVGTRGEFYDNTGALRDMVQNHVLQCLCIVAMEPPASINADSVRDAKLQVLRSLRPYLEGDLPHKTVRGQYRSGAIEGAPVTGYLKEDGIAPSSQTETFVALKAEIDNWRWAGVPFYLRTGKRMQERLAEIVINFRPVPHSIFETASGTPHNQLVIRLQPDDGLGLEINTKTPGDSMRLSPKLLNLALRDTREARRLDAYERLLMDVVRGRLALFVRRDELEAAWAWIEPIRDGWDRSGEAPKGYTSGTWGPAASSALVGRFGCAWHEED